MAANTALIANPKIWAAWRSDEVCMSASPRSRRLGDWRPVAPFHVGGLGLYKSIQRVTKPKVKKVTAVTDAPQPVLTS